MVFFVYAFPAIANQQSMICEHDRWKGFRYSPNTKSLEVRVDGKWKDFCEYGNPCEYRQDSVAVITKTEYRTLSGAVKYYDNRVIIDFFLKHIEMYYEFPPPVDQISHRFAKCQ